MPARVAFDYAIIRVVPRVERGECLNVGVVLQCRERGYVGMRAALDPTRLRAFAPGVDIALVEHQLAGMQLVCAGDPAGGPLAAFSPAERFHWLVAPSSTIIQPSAVHSGLCLDPDAELDHLLRTMVLPAQDDSAAQ